MSVFLDEFLVLSYRKVARNAIGSSLSKITWGYLQRAVELIIDGIGLHFGNDPPLFIPMGFFHLPDGREV